MQCAETQEGLLPPSRRGSKLTPLPRTQPPAMKLSVGTVIRAQAILFDMDGTLVDATGAIEQVWSRWADRHALSKDMVLRAIQGVRITDSVKTLAPAGADIDYEIATLISEEREQVEGITAIPGAVDFLADLPSQSWAVVTSADRTLAIKRMQIAGIPEAPVLIAAEDVERGKPNPDGYQLATQTLGKSAAASIVFEDSPSGLEAGRRAGCRTIAIAAALKAPPPEPQEWIEDFRTVRIEYDGDAEELALSISSGLPSAD